MFWNRRNLIIILIICLILVFVCMYRDNNMKNEKTVQTNGTPVSFHTIILDAGHGEPDRSEQVQQTELLKKK